MSSCNKSDERIDLTRYVSIYPGAPIVELTGDEAPMTIAVRNVSVHKLTSLHLEVKSEVGTAKIHPPKAAQLIPGERLLFSVKLTRDKSKPRQRYPLLLTLYASGLPVPAGLDLLVDSSLATDKGWIDVGQVTLISRPNSRLAYYLLAGAPLLFLLGWMLWRWSHPKKNSP